MKRRKRQLDGYRQILVAGELELPFLQFKSDLGAAFCTFRGPFALQLRLRAFSRMPVPPSFTKV